jgi:hypothetical protein
MRFDWKKFSWSLPKYIAIGILANWNFSCVFFPVTVHSRRKLQNFLQNGQIICDILVSKLNQISDVKVDIL